MHAASRTLAALLALTALLTATACAGGGRADGPDGGADGGGARAASADGVTTALPAPSPAAPAPAEAAEPSFADEAVAAWGRLACTATGAFSRDYLASGDPRDPAGLGLEARRERAAAMFAAQFEAVRAAATALAAAEPPRRAAGLHRLLLATYRDLDAALGEQERIVAAAATAEQIAASNAPVHELAELAFRQAALLANAGYCE